MIEKNQLELNLLNKKRKSHYIRKITSVTVLENTSDLSWIKGGEFLLTSLDTFLLKNIEDLYHLIENIHSKISGIAIKYSSKSEVENNVITKLIEVAEKFNLPVFQISNTTTYIELMDYINSELRKGAFNRNLKNQLINYLLINDKEDNLNISFIENIVEDLNLDIDFSKDKAQVIRISFDERVNYIDYIEYYFEVLKVERYLKDYFVRAESNAEEIIIFIINNHNKSIETQSDILKIDKKITEKNPTVSISSSSEIKNLNSLYYQTLLLRKTRKFFQKMEIHYEDIELIVKLTNNDKKIITEYTEPVQLLMKNNLLVETLLCFYKNNENKKKTSEDLFIHVNTLNYRLDQISKITEKDFNNLSDRIRIYLSLFIEFVREEL